MQLVLKHSTMKPNILARNNGQNEGYVYRTVPPAWHCGIATHADRTGPFQGPSRLQMGGVSHHHPCQTRPPSLGYQCQTLSSNSALVATVPREGPMLPMGAGQHRYCARPSPSPWTVQGLPWAPLPDPGQCSGLYQCCPHGMGGGQ